jgi:hypothetical protein
MPFLAVDVLLPCSAGRPLRIGQRSFIMSRIESALPALSLRA